jgi:hypothetical protein
MPSSAAHVVLVAFASLDDTQDICRECIVVHGQIFVVSEMHHQNSEELIAYI